MEELLLGREVWGTPLWRWLVAGGVALLVFTVLQTVKLWSRRLARREEHIQKYLWRTLGRLRSIPILGFSLWVGARLVPLPPDVAQWLDFALIAVVALQVGLFATGFFGFFVEVQAQQSAEDGDEDISSLGVLTFLGRLVIWSVVLLVALANMGVNITGLVASLGVGGIAVALAAQNILGDLFASLSIVLDKPFRVGDFVVVGSFAGTIKSVGLKTTRMSALSGEEVVFGNTNLLSGSIQNFKRMERRRVAFRFGVTYDSGLDPLRRVPELCREIIDKLEDVRFDRAHFAAFGASSLDFEVVYYVDGNDYLRYMDRQQAINYALFERIQGMGLDFAFPTQTLHVASWPSARLETQGVGVSSTH
jgi:small-conductance mechanosensitive channel